MAVVVTVEVGFEGVVVLAVVVVVDEVLVVV